ncbi:response regulator [Lacinutrix sp. C3R15]|uniref:ATP-binding response regulator n=1 Tax=Flavobacteriaceae TaxID=49546 RepID=UPI001C0A2492|nr:MULTISPECIES: ATP-binding protein [Flavobacteriaceae]MBU2938271.1 response regulator [Lacinutrix sp. C3R15]MDO6621585.1 ATP-binding protein [Oceanihabitans sp. 1_MG-2023]
MLAEHKIVHQKAIYQYLTTDNKGLVLESDDTFFANIQSQNIIALHPFFYSITNLLDTKKEEEFLFSCIHLDTDNKNIIADITLKTFAKENPLLIIQDLTTHYNNYQLTAQKRNESVINSQILELKNKYLIEKEEFKNTFIANFSHEIREPLSGISTFVDILKKTNLNTEQADYLNIIKTSSNHLKHMIEDILDISKIEVGKLNLLEESFNTTAFLEEIIFTYKVKAKEKGLDFNNNIEEKLPNFLLGDPYRLKQILSNLLDNAIKYTKKGSITLDVSLNQIRANKANIHFEIKDTGIGIEEENFENIFTSFSQINQNQQNKGTGLGLAIVKSLVELMHGNIAIQSDFNKGTSISFNLSFKLDGSSKKEKVKTISVEKKEKEKYNVLLVEHSEITQLSVLKILAAQKRFFLDIVSNPEDVIPTLKNQKIDIILMDINLPNKTGDTLAQEIRQLPEKELKKIPILALTGKLFPEDLKRYKKAKINDVIRKPFDEKSLLKTIHKYLK